MSGKLRASASLSALILAISMQPAAATTVIKVDTGVLTTGGGASYDEYSGATSNNLTANSTYTLTTYDYSTESIFIGATGANGNGSAIVNLTTPDAAVITTSSNGTIVVDDASNHTGSFGAYYPAATVNINNSGTITNTFMNTATSGTVILYDTHSTTALTNTATGTISGVGASIIDIEGASTASSIVNSGHITPHATKLGINVNGQFGSISNTSTGTIGASDGGYGIYVTSSGSMTSLTNAGTLTAANNAAVIVKGTLTTLTNSGTISDGTGWGAIEIGNGATVGTLTNEATGLISGASHGLAYWSTATGNVFNYGTISGGSGSAGISIQNQTGTSGTITGTLDNYGTIIGSSGGITLVNTATTGGYTSITNRAAGTISGSSDSNFAIDMRGNNNSSSGTIANYGTITGKIGLSQANVLTVYGGSISGAVVTADNGTHGSRVTFSGNFTDTAGIGTLANRVSTIRFSSGTVAVNHASLYAATIDMNGGTATLGTDVNTGASTLNFSGVSSLSLGTHTLNLASAAALTVNANSTINVTVGTSANGKIVSSGTITPTINSGTVTFAPTVSGSVLHAGDKVVLVSGLASTSGLALASAADFHMYATNGLLSDGTVGHWTLGVASSGSDLYGNSITQSSVVMTFAETAQVTANAHNVDGVDTNGGNALNAGISTGAPSTLKTILQNLTSADDVVHAGNQLSGETNRGAVEGAGSAITGSLNTVASRLDSLRGIDLGGTGLSSGDAAVGGGFWMQGFGGLGVQGTRAGSSGYKFGGAGVALGADKLVTDDLRIGAAFSYAHTAVKDTGDNTGSSTGIKSYMGTIYGSYQGEPWYVDGSLNFGLHQYTTSRLVDFSGFTDVANGSHDGYQYTAKVSGGYPLALDPFVVTPVAGLNFTHLDQDGYTESSTNGSALNVGDTHSNSVKSSLGAKATLPVTVDTYKIIPEASAAWEHEFINKAVQSTNSYAAGGSSFTTSQVKPALDAAKLGVGVTVKDGDGLSVALHYDADIKDRYVGHAGILQVRFDF